MAESWRHAFKSFRESPPSPGVFASSMNCNGRLVMMYCQESGATYILDTTSEAPAWEQIKSIKEHPEAGTNTIYFLDTTSETPGHWQQVKGINKSAEAVEPCGTNTIYFLSKNGKLKEYNRLEQEWRPVTVEESIVNILSDEEGLIGVFVSERKWDDYQLMLKRYDPVKKAWSLPFGQDEGGGCTGVMPVLGIVDGKIVMMKWVIGDTWLFWWNSNSKTWECLNGGRIGSFGHQCIGIKGGNPLYAGLYDFASRTISFWKCAIDWNTQTTEWKCWTEKCMERESQSRRWQRECTRSRGLPKLDIDILCNAE